MRFLFVSKELIGSALCHRLLREGCEVKLFIEQPGCKQSLDGIIEKTDDWHKELSWVGKDGVIVFDDVGHGAEQDALRRDGYSVVGGTEKSDRLELERSYFQEVLKDLGVPSLASYEFSEMETAEDFIRNHEGPWVVKHDTHYSALSFIGERKDGRDVISALSKLFNRNAVVTLQPRVKGVEVAVGRYFNGVDWFGPVNVNHEHKHLCNNDIGPLTPEMGTVLNFTTEREPIYERTLKKLKPLLADIGYRGYFDINFIVNEHNIWPLEATARFGTPITELQVDMLQSSLATFLSALARGEGHTPVFSNGFGVTVSLAIPPFPYSIDRIGNDFLDDQMTQIFFADDLSADDLSHIHFEEVKRLHQPSGVYGPGYYWAGDNGWVMHITGHALTIPAAQENVYRLIDKIYLPLKFYRTDIGDRVLRRDLPLLREWGLLN